MALVESFAPVAAPDARVLVLGSMPGVASLRAGRYYAHPRNGFWPIVSPLCRVAPDAPYERRLQALRDRGIALWDVLRRCERPGSLDAEIERDSAEPNDFATLFAACPQLGAVLCNGGTAHALFVRRVLPALPAPCAALPVVLLPSTSPAHAARSLAQKRAAWRRALLPWLR